MPILELFGLLHGKVILLIPHAYKRGTCHWKKSLCGSSDLSFSHRMRVSSMPDPDARWPLITKKKQAPAPYKGPAIPSLASDLSLSRGLAGDPFQLISHPSTLLTHLCIPASPSFCSQALDRATETALSELLARLICKRFFFFLFPLG